MVPSEPLHVGFIWHGCMRHVADELYRAGRLYTGMMRGYVPDVAPGVDLEAEVLRRSEELRLRGTAS